MRHKNLKSYWDGQNFRLITFQYTHMLREHSQDNHFTITKHTPYTCWVLALASPLPPSLTLYLNISSGGGGHRNTFPQYKVASQLCKMPSTL